MTIAHPPYVKGKKYRLTYTGSAWSNYWRGEKSESVFEGDRFTSEVDGWNHYPALGGYEYDVEEIEEAPMSEVLKYTVDGENFEFPVTAAGNVKIDRDVFEVFLREHTALEKTPEPIQYENGLYRDSDDDPVVIWNGELYIPEGGNIEHYARLYGPLTKAEEQ